MERESETQAVADAARTVAGIDIGSNTVRMAVAQVLPDGRLELLEQLRRAVRLGQDTFRTGRIAGRTTRAAAAILRDYRRILNLYNVGLVRAVATSAVREARNAETFLDRIFMASGIEAQVIGTSEESRLSVSAVRNEMGKTLTAGRGVAMVAEVGGGSTLLTVLRKGEIANSQSLRLGSIRLQEALATTYEPPERAVRLLRQQIQNAIATAESSLPLKKVRALVAMGADARFAADQAPASTKDEGARVVKRADLDRLVERCQERTPEQLVKEYGLPFADAETLVPALLIYQALLHAMGTKRMYVASVSMRDGLLLDLARAVTGEEEEALSKGVIQSATALAEKYRVSLDHARTVADLADALFDELREEHGLGARARLLLRAGALVHEIGSFVSNRAHHKHSHYLVSNAEIFGLTRDELAIVALVARYHRRSAPKPSHTEYTSLPRHTRMVVNKLAAVMRVADALDASHSQRVRDVTCERRDEEFVIRVAGVSDLTLERRALAAKADLFEDVYGMRVRLEEAAPPARVEPQPE